MKEMVIHLLSSYTGYGPSHIFPELALPGSSMHDPSMGVITLLVAPLTFYAKGTSYPLSLCYFHV